MFVRGEEPTTLEHIVDHIDHVAKLVGVEHVGIGVPLILLPKVLVAEWRFSAELCGRGLQPIDWQSSSVRCGERVLVD
jgi:hypothetical protein